MSIKSINKFCMIYSHTHYTGCNVGQFSSLFEIIIFCYVVAICDQVYDVETIFHISYVLRASGNLF